MANTKRQDLPEVLEKTYIPREYQVLLHNDNYTTMEFVIQILVQVFGKSTQEAYSITMQIHESGKGLAGIYSKEIAETKVYEVQSYAKDNRHPLKVTMETL